MFLCDTNVLSEFFRPQPNRSLLTWAERVSTLFLSSITIEEVSFGLAWNPKPRLRAAFETFLLERCELLPVSVEVARRSGELRGSLRSRGKSRTQADMLIAATAQIHQLTLVTRNIKDFEDCGLSLLNPFD